MSVSSLIKLSELIGKAVILITTLVTRKKRQQERMAAYENPSDAIAQHFSDGVPAKPSQPVPDSKTSATPNADRARRYFDKRGRS